MPDQSVLDLKSLSRRRFIKGSAMVAGAFTLAPYLSKLDAFAAPPVADNEGILITIFLAGGNDGLNMVAPVADPAYASLRPTLKIAGGYDVGSGLALHPSLAELKGRFDQGKVAIVRGVGYQPPDLSHFSSTDIWMHGWGGGGVPTTGWVGRYLDGLPNTEHESMYGVVLHGGVNEHLWGAVSNASSLPLSISGAFGIDRSDPSDAWMYDALINMGNGASGLGDLGDLYDNNEMEFLQLAQRIEPAYDFDPPTADISQQLVLAAHLINANLGVRVFDTELDGFDTHSDQADWHATLLGQLDTAIAAFDLALDPRWRGAGDDHDVLRVRPAPRGGRRRGNRPRHRGAGVRDRRSREGRAPRRAAQPHRPRRQREPRAGRRLPRLCTRTSCTPGSTPMTRACSAGPTPASRCSPRARPHPSPVRSRGTGSPVPRWRTGLRPRHDVRVGRARVASDRRGRGDADAHGHVVGRARAAASSASATRYRTARSNGTLRTPSWEWQRRRRARGTGW